MHKAIIVGTALMVSACTVIPSTFDSVGYNNMVGLKHQAVITMETCDKADSIHREIKRLDNMTDINVIYLNNAREDTALVSSINTVSRVVDEMVDKYKDDKNPGAIYCTLKMQLINYTLDVMVSTVGGRQR